MGNRGLGLLWKSQFMKEKNSHFKFYWGKKKGQLEIMQILFNTQLEIWREFNNSFFKYLVLNFLKL